MSRTAFGATLGTLLGNGVFNTTSAPTNPASTDVALAVSHLATLTTNVSTANGALTTNVAAAVAALVADGATPTQGHVTTLNTAWGLLATAIAALSTSAVSADLTAITADDSADVVLDFNLATVTTMNGLKTATAHLLRRIEGSDRLTP
jgi:hypothetical protein